MRRHGTLDFSKRVPENTCIQPGCKNARTFLNLHQGRTPIRLCAGRAGKILQGATMFSIRTTLLSASIFALAACGSSFDGPDEGEIGDFLEMELPEGVDVDSIEIVASQNEGDEIEPVYRTRSNITLSLEEDFAEQVGMIGDRPLIKIVAEEGTEYDGILFTRGEPIGDDDWSVESERLQIRNMKGMPLSSFDDYVIEGSDEEKDARETAKREEAEEEKRAADQLASAQRAFVGSWSASQPLTRNGSVFSQRGTQIGISFNLGPNEDGYGKGTGRVYNFSDPSIYAEAPITYTVTGEGDVAQVTFLETARHDELPFYVSSDSVWKLSSDGVVDGGRWDIKLSK